MKKEKVGWVVLVVVTVVGLACFSCASLVVFQLTGERKVETVYTSVPEETAVRVVGGTLTPTVEVTGIPEFLWDDPMAQEPWVDGEAAYLVDAEGVVGALHLPSRTRIWAWEYFERAERIFAQNRDKLFVLRSDNRVYALDKKTGETAWKLRFSSDDVLEDFELDNERLYLTVTSKNRGLMGGYDHFLRAYDIGSGEELWLDVLRSPTSYLVSDSYVFATDPEGEASVLDAERGGVQATVPGEARWYCLGVTNGVAFFVPASKGIGGFDYQVGEVLWTREQSYVRTEAIPQEGKVLIRDGHGTYGLLEARTGKLLWDTDEQRNVEYVGFLEDLVFLVKSDIGETGAVDLESGQVRWVNDEMLIDWPIATTQHGLLLARQRPGYLYLVDPKTGKFVWRFAHDLEDNQTYISDALLIEDEVLVAAGSYLYLLDLETGATKWKMKLGRFWELRSLHRSPDLIVMTADDYMAVLHYTPE
ncbi:MAG: PQQ-binding-like beta-propeller repeat protein [Patescibacteria group bacterium]|nr:PQQ-binding-like beta-propeller repeat protein [Patescibacteria group bacterium]